MGKIILVYLSISHFKAKLRDFGKQALSKYLTTLQKITDLSLLTAQNPLQQGLRSNRYNLQKTQSYFQKKQRLYTQSTMKSNTPKHQSVIKSFQIIKKIVAFVPTLKYLTVLTLSSKVASSSHIMRVWGCCWKADTVHMWLTPSSMALYRAKDLWVPVIKIITQKANREVFIYTVIIV